VASWVCRRDGVVFPVGLPQCPMITCGARDAYEQGGDESINVYDAVDLTGIKDPGAAWDAVNSVAATARHELRQDGQETLSQTDGVASLLSSTGEAEVGERLGLVPGDPGPRDSSTDPVPVGEEVELTGDGTGTALPDAAEGDNTERVHDPAVTSASAKKRQGKDVPS
jgi:hypothetical protein